MPDADPDRVPPIRSFRPHVRHLPDCVLFLIVGGALVRLYHLDSPQCWHAIILSGLMALVYAGGLALWDRLGAGARCGWSALLFVLWTLLLFIAPPPLPAAYVWCAVPLACAALRALDRRFAVAAVVLISGVLVAALVRQTGRFDPDVVLAPLAAVWSTVFLYRAQQRDATARQRLVEELRGTRRTLARQQHEAGVLAERARIARDLHDTLAQELAGSLMLLQAAEREWDHRPEAARGRVRSVAESLGANLTETRRIIGDLTPPSLGEEGLESALRVLCARAQAAGAAAEVRFQAVGEQSHPLIEDAAVALLRVAQGALANVREHAHATTALVTLHREADRVSLEVRDDGRGFEPARAASGVDGSGPGGGGRGFGLPAARARLDEYGGTLDVSSTPGRGTRIRATVAARPTLRPAHSPLPSRTAAVAV